MEYNLGMATDQEIIALRQLLDHAVRSGGMGVAEAALHWNRKLMLAMQGPPPAANGKVPASELAQ